MRKHLVPLLAALLAAAATASFALADQQAAHGRHGHPSAYAIGLWGDMPYNADQQTTGVPNLIADMNRRHLAFIAHDGDIKSGSEQCTDDVYTRALGYFNSSKAPAMFTPGDNEWTDCDRANNGAYDSLERLAHLRGGRRCSRRRTRSGSTGYACRYSTRPTWRTGAGRSAA